MKRVLLIAALALSVTAHSLACDACGCSVAGPGIGVYTAFYSNFVRVGWQYAGFEAIKQFGEGSRDQFHMVDVSGRVHITPRIKVLFQVPYRVNVRKDGASHQTLHGLSDLRLMAGYTLVDNKSIGDWSVLFLEVAGGVEFPAGKYDPDLRDQDILPENFNIGSGSWDLLLQGNMVWKAGEFGLILSGSYQHNGLSPDEYRFGDQFTAQGLIFWEKTLKSGLRIIPAAGLYHEAIRDDKSPSEIPVTATGGTGTYGAFGLNFAKGRVLWGVTYSPVFRQDYSDGEVRARDRMNIQISYTF